MRVLATPFTALLLLFFVISAPPTSTTAEMESPTSQPDNLAPAPSPYAHFPSHKTCSLFSFFIGNCFPQLSSVYFAFSIVYLCFLVYWISVCFKVKPTFRRIHLLMAGLVVVKALSLIYEAVNVTGTHGSDLFFYISKFIGVVRLSIVIQLIASGCYFMEPIMQNVDRMVLLFLIPLQVLANVVKTVIGDSSDSINDWMNLIDLITCSLMIYPIICSMVSMCTGGMSAKNFERLNGFRYFYMIVVLYLLFVNVVVEPVRKNGAIGLNAIDAEVYLLKANVLFEFNSLNFYMIVCSMFKKQFALLVDHDESKGGCVESGI
ncbi:unnamed protein product [Lactuca saligna]|uniref:GOST seven transmembrane domain-containing protein n=1 Tax=Lactuca saligna TaxID=75948 RepID=A0AA35YYV5_LACSI|nr:unnamed protein product [Lactuca saligna]